MRKLLLLSLTLLLLCSAACMVGPNYKRPAAPVPQSFKEAPPDGWKTAQPNDGAIRGKWWEVYNDQPLNALEEQVSITNQNVLAAEADFRAARYAIRVARASLFPTVGVSPTVQISRQAINFPGESGIIKTYSLPVSASWPVDIWGAVRRSVHAATASAQSDYALLENARLSYQSELAQEYFEMRGIDGDIDLLTRTVKSYAEYLTLTQNRYKSGVASGADVAQAQTQLDTTQAQLIDLGVARAQYEHAIAILIGKPPSELSLDSKLLKTPPPPTPPALPSALLERRPDIAAAERQMAAVQEQIGIAVAAYYPTLNLTASAGFGPAQFSHGFIWPSRVFSAGVAPSETVFEGGKRHAQVKEAEALFDASVASYRETVLGAFQQVEDDLSALRIYGQEAVAIEKAVKDAEDSLAISTYQYKAGTVAYLQVLTAQAVALGAERTAVDLLARRMVSSVLLIQALGGGWDSKNIPSANDLMQSR
ncbi:MAG TPA: efflux transporter outer membrane subunit [Bryobacteraceae bacterium]|nr:efflux transporter outer membrane subunit [Bryobacteraceae bacterium]